MTIANDTGLTKLRLEISFFLKESETFRATKFLLCQVLGNLQHEKGD
jgi:hypothetical protein